MPTLPDPTTGYQQSTIVLREPGQGIGLIPIVDSTGRIITVVGAGDSVLGRVKITDGTDVADVTTDGELEVLEPLVSTFDHGSNRDIDATAEQITSTSFAPKRGILLKADAANTGILYIGNSDVTAGTTGATDGFPLSAGDSMVAYVSNVNLLYAIGSAANQIIYWWGT